MCRPISRRAGRWAAGGQQARSAVTTGPPGAPGCQRPSFFSSPTGSRGSSVPAHPSRPEKPAWPATASGAQASATSTRLSPSDFSAGSEVMTSTDPIRTKAGADVLSSGRDGPTLLQTLNKKAGCPPASGSHIMSTPKAHRGWGGGSGCTCIIRALTRDPSCKLKHEGASTGWMWKGDTSLQRIRILLLRHSKQQRVSVLASDPGAGLPRGDAEWPVMAVRSPPCARGAASSAMDSERARPLHHRETRLCLPQLFAAHTSL